MSLICKNSVWQKTSTKNSIIPCQRKTKPGKIEKKVERLAIKILRHNRPTSQKLEG